MVQKFLLGVFLQMLMPHVYGQTIYEYPSAEKDSTVDEYFGERIPDPYQWMENPNDPRLPLWLDEQEKLKKRQSRQHNQKEELGYLVGSIYWKTYRDQIDSIDIEKGIVPIKYLFKHRWNSKGKSPDLLYKHKNWVSYQTLIYSRQFKRDKGDHVSWDKPLVKHNLAIVRLSINGSDWQTGYIFDLISGKQLPHRIDNLRKSSTLRWHGMKLYYDAFDAPTPGRELLDVAKGQKLFCLDFENLDMGPKMIYQNADTTGTNRLSFASIDDKLILYHHLPYKGEYLKCVSIANLTYDDFIPRTFITYPNSDSIALHVEIITNDSLFIRTNWKAPNGRVLMANVSLPNSVVELVPEHDIVLKKLNKLGKGKIACIYSHEGRDIVLVHDYKGEYLKKIPFPAGTKLRNFFEHSDDSDQTIFTLSAFFHPLLRFQLSLDDLTYQPFEQINVPYDVEKFETRYVRYRSKDGTSIPMYITCHKDTELNGENPVLLYGYGGYGITVQPTYNEFNMLFLLNRGILAIPNIRGGGAEGGAWGLAGRRLNKQNAIDDFISAAEYLVEEGYSNNNKIVISGSSHGGMLVGASLTQRPDLFKAAIAEAGAFDMLRVGKYTAGAVSTNIQEYGSIKIEEDFQNLKSYSPIHQVKKGVRYPNTLLITGDSDDRVPPHHSYKFLAQLQELGDPAGQYLLYITPGAGHSGARTIKDYKNYIFFKYNYLFDQLNIDL